MIKWIWLIGYGEIKTDAGTQFTSQEFQEGISIRGVHLVLVAKNHQEMNEQVEVTWWTLWTITHSIMMHAWFSENVYTFYINVQNLSYTFCSTNQTLGKIEWWTNYATKTGNSYKNFMIKPKCFILSICFTKGNCKCWKKGIKYLSSVTQVFLG